MRILLDSTRYVLIRLISAGNIKAKLYIASPYFQYE